MYFSIISKYTATALLRTNNKMILDKELSLLERVLARENDTKVASILALDLLLVGIDTVSIFYVVVHRMWIEYCDLSRVYK